MKKNIPESHISAAREEQDRNSKILEFHYSGILGSFVFYVKKTEFVIGKNPQCDGVINVSSAISRRHCKLFRQGEEYYITDLGSKNHTYLNDRMLVGQEAVPVHDGDRVRLADVEFTVREEVAVRKKYTHVIYTSSVGGGCGKTLMSLGIASALAETGQRTLYINTESMQDFGYYLTDAVYMQGKMAVLLSADPGAAAEEILVNAGKQGFDYLPPSEHLLMSSEITLEKIMDFVTALVRRNDYDDIVVELPGSAGEDEIACMNAAEYLVLIADQSEYSSRRLRLLNENLRDFHGDGYIVCSRYDAKKANYLEEQDFSIRFPVCEYVKETEEQMTLEKIRMENIMKKTAQAVV